ncbi:hypothetical protein GYA19_02105 [Candidatus Beckwithbacteria bacterium]|nr:hypothetical protein [Candidatus Beckwithbacteria bacterium]
MKILFKNAPLLFSFFAVGIIIFDQFSKLIVFHYFSDSVILNTQGTFGILPAWVAFVALFLILVFLLKTKKFLPIFGVIIGAGLSNILDRFFYCGVVDFIKFSFIPIFNLADAVISLSVLLLILYELKKN